jgi:hypothetical protein
MNDTAKNVMLAVLIVGIAVAVFYMIDPTFGGLMRGSEGFQDMNAGSTSAAAMTPDAQGQMLPDAADSVSGMKKEKFENGKGNADALKILSDNANALQKLMANSEKFANKFPKKEKFQDAGMGATTPMATPPMEPAVPPMMPAAPSASLEGFANLNPQESPFPEGTQPANCYPKNQLAPQELLPTDPNSKWAAVNPTGAGDISGKNFLGAGALIGVNTVGQSLRNANLQLRSEPANPQMQVSIWNQSTIQPDLQRRPLEGF